MGLYTKLLTRYFSPSPFIYYKIFIDIMQPELFGNRFLSNDKSGIYSYIANVARLFCLF